MGLDRTTVPMEEPLELEEAAERRLKKRKKPYVRKPPDPVEVNYRMAYVGTVSFVDVDGRCVRTVRYFASAEQGPKDLVDSMMRDVKQARRSRPELPLSVVQDGAVEMWNLIEAGLKKHKLSADAELIDRYHLHEHLGTALRAAATPPPGATRSCASGAASSTRMTTRSTRSRAGSANSERRASTSPARCSSTS